MLQYSTKPKRRCKRKFKPQDFQPPPHREINNLAQQFNFDMESKIEQAIDLLVEHDYIDGEGEQWRPRIKRKGSKRNFGWRKPPLRDK